MLTGAAPAPILPPAAVAEVLVPPSPFGNDYDAAAESAIEMVSSWCCCDADAVVLVLL